MLTEVEYKPFEKNPYKVSMFHKGMKVPLQAFADESSAISLAMEKSRQSEMPYKIRFQDGQRLNHV